MSTAASKTKSKAGPIIADELNRKIIARLEKDGRAGYSAIAAEIGVSESAVRKRVQRMQDSGQVRIVAIVNPPALNYDTYTMMGIKVTPGYQPGRVGERLSLCPEVVFATWVSGPYDLLIEAFFDQQEKFLDFLSTEIHGHPDVQDCDIMQNLKVFKNTYILMPELKP